MNAEELLLAIFGEQPLVVCDELAHWECDCVPDIGPSHCHGCSDAVGHEVEWSKRLRPAVTPEETEQAS